MQATQYDYIFLGAGAASLSIVLRMIDSNKFADKKILLIDKKNKNTNDRTWCFWEHSIGFFEDIVYRKWSKLLFYADDKKINLDIDSYQYKMIRGIDFYKKCFSLIDQQKNIEVLYGDISFEKDTDEPVIQLNEELLEYKKNAIIFNSIYKPEENNIKTFHLLQHFKGFIIETKDKHFDAAQATLMDFRVKQNNGTTFVYVLPLSPHSALIEYTSFSEKVLDKDEYNIHLKNYIEQFLLIKDYTICEEEFGVIPMTNHKFSFYKNGMYYIGTAGGQTKASTGYTFSFIQKQAESIVEALISKTSLLQIQKTKRRFLFYDSTLLHILSKRLLDGKKIFTMLFKRNKAGIIFKFLDNETNFPEEIKLLNTLPKRVFLKAGFKEFMKMIFSRYL